MAFLELFDETLDINSTENYEIGIKAGVDGFSFCLLDTLRNKFVLIRSFMPEDTNYYNAHIVKDFLLKDEFLSKHYKGMRLIVPSSKFTLVPSALYDPAKKDEYFTFNHRLDPGYKIISNKLTDPDAFIIYALDRSFHDLFSELYPSVHPTVHIQSLFEYMSIARKNMHGNYIHVHLERDYFSLIIFQSNRLQFCNTFNYRNISDILYYVLNVFNKIGIKQEETIFFSGMTDKYDDLHTAFSAYIRSVKLAEPKGACTFSYVFNEMELHRYLDLFSIFNCE